MQAYNKAKKIFKKLAHLQYTQKIMMWDEAVMMPEGAGAYRAQAVATLEGLMHKMLIKKTTQAAIEEAKGEYEHLSAWDQANLKWMEKEYLNAACIPSALTEKYTKAKMSSEQAWRKLRAQNNWREFLPHLENTFTITREIAERRAQAFHLHPYDALLDYYAPGFTQKSIDPIFAELKKSLPALISQIMKKQATDQLIQPQGPFAIEKQKTLGMEIMKSLCFDFNYGRLDTSHHPFCNGIGEDVRITTRYTDNEFITSLMGICHETGHALYEQGLPKKWQSQPVGSVHSMAMHESQSLLVEMQVCRSPKYFNFIQDLIQRQFGQQAAFSADNLFKLSTRVKPSYIRVDADEVTYPLHIILRYEIEKGLFNGDFSIKDLPQHWDEFMQKYLGLSTKGNDKDGVMQDVHWPSGAFGYFPAYTLGRIMGSQFYASFSQKHPHFPQELQNGNFKPLVDWLREEIHGKGSSLSNADLLKQVTGKDLETKFFIDHVENRYLAEVAQV